MTPYNQNRRRLLTAAIIVCFIVIALALYWALKGGKPEVPAEKEAARETLPRMSNLPPEKKRAMPPPPSYPTDAPILEQVRKALSAGLDPAGALAMAKSLPDRPERADAAFLLFEYAAEMGNSEAALAVARYYDPTDNGPAGSIRKDPETAYEWYRQALGGGEKEAEKHLGDLRRWLEEEVAKGSRKAKELLN